MGNAMEDFVVQLRRLAEGFIKKHYVEEKRYFPTVWEVFEQWIRELNVPVEELPIMKVLPSMHTGLGFTGEEGIDLVSPIVLATVAETLQKSRSKRLSVSGLESIVGKAATRAGATGELLACLIGHLPVLVIAVLSTDDSVSGVSVPDANKGQKQQIEVKFVSANVLVNGREVGYDNAWRMLEYFLWKKDLVHWLEGYLMYPKWWREGVGKPQKLFREKNDSYSKKLRDNYGLEIEFKTNRKQKADYWELTKHNLSINIPDAERNYRKAEQLFENEDVSGAKDELQRALEIYPNHIQSHLLLVKCYEKHNFEDAPAGEINRILRPSWEYMRRKCSVLDGIAKIVSEKKDEELDVFLTELKSNPIYFGVKEHTLVLEKWFRKNVFTEEDRILAKLKTLLESIASSTDDVVRGKNIAELYEMSCVKDVMSSIGKDWLEIAARLFYLESRRGSGSTRLEAMAKLNFSRVRQFKAYLKKTLMGIAKERHQERLGKIPVSDASSGMRWRIKHVNKIEAELRQKLHKEPSEPELIEALEIQQGWDIEEIKDVLNFRNFQITLRGDMSILGDKEGTPHAGHEDNEQAIQ